MRYKDRGTKPPTGKEPPTVLALVVQRTDLIAPPPLIGSTSWKRKFGFGGKEGGGGLG